jgi:hypothetical protein
MSIVETMTAGEILTAMRDNTDLWLVHAPSRSRARALLTGDHQIAIAATSEGTDTDRRSREDAIAFAETARQHARIVIVRLAERMLHRDTSALLEFAREAILHDPDALDNPQLFKGFKNETEARGFYGYSSNAVFREKDNRTAKELAALVDPLARAIAASLHIALAQSGLPLLVPLHSMAEIVLASWVLLEDQDLADAAHVSDPAEVVRGTHLRADNVLMFARRPALISILWSVCRPDNVPIPFAAGSVSEKGGQSSIHKKMSGQAACWLMPVIAWLDEVFHAHPEALVSLGADAFSIEARIAILVGVAPIINAWEAMALSKLPDKTIRLQASARWESDIRLLSASFLKWLTSIGYMTAKDREKAQRQSWMRASFLAKHGCDTSRIQRWLSSIR